MAHPPEPAVAHRGGGCGGAVVTAASGLHRAGGVGAVNAAQPVDLFAYLVAVRAGKQVRAQQAADLAARTGDCETLHKQAASSQRAAEKADAVCTAVAELVAQANSARIALSNVKTMSEHDIQMVLKSLTAALTRVQGGPA